MRLGGTLLSARGEQGKDHLQQASQGEQPQPPQGKQGQRGELQHSQAVGAGQPPRQMCSTPGQSCGQRQQRHPA